MKTHLRTIRLIETRLMQNSYNGVSTFTVKWIHPVSEFNPTDLKHYFCASTTRNRLFANDNQLWQEFDGELSKLGTELVELVGVVVPGVDFLSQIPTDQLSSECNWQWIRGVGTEQHGQARTLHQQRPVRQGTVGCLNAQFKQFIFILSSESNCSFARNPKSV